VLETVATGSNQISAKPFETIQKSNWSHISFLPLVVHCLRKLCKRSGNELKLNKLEK
jgi:hypothetical protein